MVVTHGQGVPVGCIGFAMPLLQDLQDGAHNAHACLQGLVEEEDGDDVDRVAAPRAEFPDLAVLSAPCGGFDRLSLCSHWRRPAHRQVGSPSKAVLQGAELKAEPD
eukprot:10547441-Lingulodinium_polyedra.AAC.1